MICRYCGEDIRDTDTYCSNCGEALIEPGQQDSRPKKKLNKRLIVIIALVLLVTSGFTAAAVYKKNLDDKIKSADIKIESLKASGQEDDSVAASDESAPVTQTIETVADAEPEKAQPESIEIDYDELIRQQYTDELEYETLIRATIMQNLEAASYIQPAPEGDPTDYRKLVTDAIVDNAVEGEILSEGAKSAIDAICEGKSTEEIISDTKAGLVSGVDGYIKSSVKDYIMEELDVDIEVDVFDEVAWIKEFLNVDDTPVALLNGMISRQKADVEILLAFINKESFEPGELQYASALYKRIARRQEEIIAAGGSTSPLSDEDSIDAWIAGYDKARGTIYGLSKLRELGIDCDNPSDTIDKSLFSKYLNASNAVLPANYDVDGYRQEQLATERGGMVTQKFFGNLVGSMASDDLKNNQKIAQQSRVSFCSDLEDSLNDSCYSTCLMRGFFNELYYASDNEYVNADARVIPHDELVAAVQAYLGQEYKYVFDLNNVSIFMTVIASDLNAGYISKLDQTVQAQYQTIQNGIDDGIFATGYDPEEEHTRYINLVNSYIQYLTTSMNYANYEPQYQSVSSVTAYEVGEFSVYYKGKAAVPTVLAEEQLKTNFHKERYLWVYDVNGNPLYVSNQYGKTYIMNDQMISFTGESEDVGMRIKDNADRIIKDIKSGEIAHSYKDYVL